MSTLNIIQISLELWNSFFCLCLAVLVFVGKDFINKSSRILLHLLLSSSVLLFFDSMAYFFRGNVSTLGVIMTRVSNFVVFATEYALIVLITYYFYITLLENNVDAKKKTVTIIGMGMLIEFVLLIVTQFTGFYYSFDVTNHYMRGSGIVVNYVIAYSCILYSGVRVWRYRKQISSRYLWSMLSYVIIALVASVLQVLFYGLSLTNLGLAITILIMLVIHELEYVKMIQEKTVMLVEQEKKLAEGRTRNILSTIHPHFIFNSLAVIEALIRINPEQAQDAVGSLSGFLRSSIDTLKLEDMISIHKELQTVEHYMAIMQKRFGDEIQMKIDIPKDCEFQIPPFTLQPLVENSISHGIRKKADMSGTVEIIVHKKEDGHVIYVKDDGVGFDAIKAQDDGHEHVGLSVVEERLKMMCNGTFAIESEAGKGCCCTIVIPNRS